MRIKAGIIKHKVFGAVGVLGLLLSFSAAANPEGGVVAAGSATITNADKLTTIKQATDKAVIDWRSFNIAPDEHTEFKQPSASSITLNRINDTNPSAINGRLTANGHVMLINPNGILFGKNSVIDVAAITASTANISNKNFMAGKFNFDQAGKADGFIQNDGLITAKEAGLANFVAPRFLNSGIITAKLGKIQVGSGETFTLDMAGDGLLKVAINKDTRLGQQIINQGLMSANGGQVRLTAAAAREVVDSVISNSGIIEATSISEKNGVIRLEGKNSTVINSGTINASGRKEKQRGGDITITGKNVALMDGTLIDASGHTGKSNTTNDKTLTQKREGAAGGDIKIGGDYLGKGDTPTAENLYVSPNSFIFNDALEYGDAGRTIFWSDNTTSFYGNVFARANVGDGGFVETSGHKFLDAQGSVDLTTNHGARGTYFLDPTDIAIYGNVDPAFNSTDGSSISLSASLKLWLDASDTAKVNLTYNTLGTTATGTSGTNTITVSANTGLVVGARIRLGAAGSVTAASTLGADTYTVSNIAGTTITLSSNLTTGYAGSTIYQGYVSQLTDKSTVGTNHATQATAGNMPLWISNGLNGIGAISPQDSSDWLGTPSMTVNQRSYFTAYKLDSTTGYGFGGFNSLFLQTTPNYYQFYTSGGVWGYYDGTLRTLQAANTNPEIMSLTNGAGLSAYSNGNLTLSNADSTSALSAPFNIGGYSGTSYATNGKIGEVIVHNTALGANPRNLIEQYQSAKWGIALDPIAGAGTEVAEATSATGYSVFTTRYLERLATSANISLQATNNITLDLKGDNLNFTTANRSLTLNAGNQIINASAGTITTNNGAISLTGTNGIVLNNALTLNSGTATTTFNSRVNGANNLTATAGTFSFAQPLGGTTPLGAVSLTSANAFNLPSISASSITASTTTGNIAGAGGLVTSGGNLNLTAGTDLDLSAIGIITNNGNASLSGRDVTLNTWINTGTGNFTVNASRDIFLTRNNLTSGLVSYYTFDEGSGTTALDSAGSNNGTLTNGPT